MLNAQLEARQSASFKSLGPAEPLHIHSKHGLKKQIINGSTPRHAPRGLRLLTRLGSPQKFILREFSPCLRAYRTQVLRRESRYRAGMPDASARAIDRTRGIGRPWRIWLGSHLRREEAVNECNGDITPTDFNFRLADHTCSISNTSAWYLLVSGSSKEQQISIRICDDERFGAPRLLFQSLVKGNASGLKLKEQ